MELTQYNSPEYNILLDIFVDTKCDKWIAQLVESYIYEWKCQEVDLKWAVINERYLTRFLEKNGECKAWFKNGRLYKESNYKDGKLDGECKLWSLLKDRVYSLRIYKDGITQGEFKEWHDNGNLQTQGYYKEGKLNGEYKTWYENGQLYKYFNYEDNILKECKEWDQNGQLKLHLLFKDNKKNGEYNFWHHNGQLLRQCNYKNEKLHGPFREWDLNGVLRKDEMWGAAVTLKQIKTLKWLKENHSMS